MNITDVQFDEVAQKWDLKTLYADLATIKGKPLTPTEKLHLRGLLFGYSPSEIATKLNKNPKGVETDLCATIYKYVKSLVGKDNDKVENWRKISDWLEEAGYRYPLSLTMVNPSLTNNAVPDKNNAFNVTNITVDSDHITIGVYLQITVPLPADGTKSPADVIKNLVDNGLVRENVWNGNEEDNIN